jgi:hypothetical protein
MQREPAMVIYSTTVSGQDRRIERNERVLRACLPAASVVYLDMVCPDERARMRTFLSRDGCTCAMGNVNFPVLYVDGRFVHHGGVLCSGEEVMAWLRREHQGVWRILSDC